VCVGSGRQLFEVVTGANQRQPCINHSTCDKKILVLASDAIDKVEASTHRDEPLRQLGEDFDQINNKSRDNKIVLSLLLF
jgi:hypothetical protein